NCRVEMRLSSAPGFWDRLRVEQIITNLISNAVKYAPGARVEVSVEPDGNDAKLVVRDEGIGIAPENLGRIFERFERAVPTNAYGGLGVGLYIVRTIVQAHEGSIAVASEPAKGSTFTVRLPMNAAVSLSERPPRPSGFSSSPSELRS